MTELLDPDGETALLGAALVDETSANWLIEQLTTRDFSSRSRARVFRAIASIRVEGRDVSPAVVVDELGPDLIAELELGADALEAWAMDSPARTDPKLFEHLTGKLKRLTTARDFQAKLRSALVDNPLEMTDAQREDVAAKLQEADLALGSLGALNGKTQLNVVDLVSAFDQVEPIPWCYKAWLAQGDVGILAGEGGAGKSWVLLDLSFSLAIGGDAHWLGDVWPAVAMRPQRVLYCDMEQRERMVKHRLNRWMVGAGFDREKADGLALRYLADNDLGLDSEMGLKRLMLEIDNFRPDWIMLDSFVRFHSRNENDNSEMSRLFTERIRPLAQRCNAGVIALHHYGKGDGGARQRVRGAGDIFNQVDFLWTLCENEETGGAVIRLEKNRWGVPTFPLRVEIEDVKGDTGVQVRAVGRADDASGAILECLEDAGEEGALRKQLVDAVAREGLKAPGQAVKRHIKQLHTDGKIRSAQDGRAKRFWLYDVAPLEAR